MWDRHALDTSKPDVNYVTLGLSLQRRDPEALQRSPSSSSVTAVDGQGHRAGASEYTGSLGLTHLREEARAPVGRATGRMLTGTSAQLPIIEICL